MENYSRSIRDPVINIFTQAEADNIQKLLIMMNFYTEIKYQPITTILYTALLNKCSNAEEQRQTCHSYDELDWCTTRAFKKMPNENQ